MDYVVGVDLGGTKILTALADAGGNILARVRVATGAADGVDAVVDRLAASVRRAAGGAALGAVGVGAPGSLDHHAGIVHYSPNLGWRDVPLGAMLRRRLGVPVRVDNDANLAALGEYTRGAGRGCRHMVYVTVSTGVGGGLVLDGRIYRGEAGGAGEIGHMILDPAGPPCTCGQRGCLEAMASGTAIARAAREFLDRGGKGALREIAGGPVTARDVAQAAARGDAAAAAIMEDAALCLGRGLANVVTLLAPRLVVVGGGVMEAGPPFWDAVRTEALRRTYAPAREQVDLVPALLTGESGLYGAVALAAREPA